MLTAVLAALLVLALGALALVTTMEDEDARPEPTGAYRNGDCLHTVTEGYTSDLIHPTPGALFVPCTGPHTAQVIGVVDLQPGPDGGQPSGAQVDHLLDTECAEAFEDVLGRAHSDEDELVLGGIAPTTETWMSGNHAGYCLVTPRTDDPGVTGSISGSLVD